MTLLQSSLILTRATNTHSQLRYLAGLNQDRKYKALLSKMDIIYNYSDTQESRELLREFLNEHSDEIYRKATQQNESYQTHYDLKDE